MLVFACVYSLVSYCICMCLIVIRKYVVVLVVSLFFYVQAVASIFMCLLVFGFAGTGI